MPITCRADVLTAAALVRHFAIQRGATRTEAAALSTVAAEMVQNVVTHARCRGELRVSDAGGEIVLQSLDSGPGMEAPHTLFAGAQARSEMGLATGVGLGEGGSAMRRLMDRVDATSGEHGGLVVTARKRLGRKGSRG